jgi:hypothetical protein
VTPYGVDAPARLFLFVPSPPCNASVLTTPPPPSRPNGWEDISAHGKIDCDSREQDWTDDPCQRDPRRFLVKTAAPERWTPAVGTVRSLFLSFVHSSFSSDLVRPMGTARRACPMRGQSERHAPMSDRPNLAGKQNDALGREEEPSRSWAWCSCHRLGEARHALESPPGSLRLRGTIGGLHQRATFPDQWTGVGAFGVRR